MVDNANDNDPVALELIEARRRVGEIDLVAELSCPVGGDPTATLENSIQRV
jgi:hypothetical protein